MFKNNVQFMASIPAQTAAPSETNKFDTVKYGDVWVKKPVIYAVSIVRGFRRSQEDRWTVIRDLHPANMSWKQPVAYFAVFDGHRGSAMAEHAHRHLHLVLAASELYRKGLFRPALREAFITMDEHVRQDKVISLSTEEEDKNYFEPEGESTISGCTATVVLLTRTTIWAANVGDSRAVLCRKGEAVALTIDHSPFKPEEYNRIVAAGSRVVKGKVGMLLNMSRSLGDIHTKSIEGAPPEVQPITSVPDITETAIGSDDEFLVLMTDGVWNSLRNKERECREELFRIDPGGKTWGKMARLSDKASTEEAAEAIGNLAVDQLGTAILSLSPADSYTVYRAGEILSNQNIIDTVRWCIAQHLPLRTICDTILDFCLENYNGNDNATIIIVPILGGRSLERWYKWVAKRVQSGYGRQTPFEYPVFEERPRGSRSLNDLVEEAKRTK